MILRAAWVLAGGSDGLRLVENGAVRFEGGVIVEIDPAPRIGSGGEGAENLGDCLLLPGLVNAHTHLELSHLAGRLQPGSRRVGLGSLHRDTNPPGDPSRAFVDWLDRLLTTLRADGGDPRIVEEAAHRGRKLSLAAGVTTVGDITRWPGLTRPVLADGPLRVLSFGEVIAIGRLRGRLDERLSAAVDDSDGSEFLETGVSPHAPYTLEPEGLRTCVRRAATAGQRLCIHLAETPAEAEFTTRLAGPLREYLARHGTWDEQVPSPGMRPIEYADSVGLLSPAAILAHVNYVEDDEIALLAERGVHVAYCPRTHAAFGHEPHAFLRMLERGVNVCVGTDSLASNPSLSVLEELRFLRRNHPQVAPELWFEMGTIRAAQALGMDRADSRGVGAIAPGRRADLTVIPLEGRGHPLENVLESEAVPMRTYVAGRLVANHRS